MRHFPLICIHGYGVRASFWDGFIPSATSAGLDIRTPSLRFEDIPSAVEEIMTICSESAVDGPVALMGHSLGGILSALAAKRMPPETVSRLIVLASPYGKRIQEMSRFMRFMLWRGLIPQFLTRPRFFGRGVPVKVQKRLFDQAVRESPNLQAAVSNPIWFHTGEFQTAAMPRSMIVASAADRIVPHQESREFATAIGAEFHLFDASLRIGHDDYGVDARVASLLLEKIVPFIAI